MYQIKRVHIGRTPQLDELAHECGLLYSQTLVFFWRTVRHKGIWLKPKHLMRLFTSSQLHAHTSDACVQAFFASLKSWRERRKSDPTARPPRRRRWYFRIEYKRSAMRMKDNKLLYSNGKGNEPLALDWPWTIPQTLVIRWTGTEHEAIATYEPCYLPVPENGSSVAGIDLGEIHMATQLALDALAVAEECRSWVNIYRIDALHQDLKASRYGKSIAVAELGTQLFKIKHLELFT